MRNPVFIFFAALCALLVGTAIFVPSNIPSVDILLYALAAVCTVIAIAEFRV